MRGLGSHAVTDWVISFFCADVQIQRVLINSRGESTARMMTV